jgi:ketosteroid isomerase-like protein
MDRSLDHRLILGTLAALASIGLAACGAAPPAKNAALADEVTAAWVAAFDTGDAATLAAIYAEEAHSTPSAGVTIAGRSAIESYWREDMGAGTVVTKLAPGDSIAQGDLLHLDGTYDVVSPNGVTLAKGQYEQLWTRADGAWQVRQETWRLDPSLDTDPGRAERLSSLWTTAYNAGDAAALMALYDQDAELSTDPSETMRGRDVIGAFWSALFS